LRKENGKGKGKREREREREDRVNERGTCQDGLELLGVQNPELLEDGQLVQRGSVVARVREDRLHRIAAHFHGDKVIGVARDIAGVFSRGLTNSNALVHVDGVGEGGEESRLERIPLRHDQALDENKLAFFVDTCIKNKSRSRYSEIEEKKEWNDKES